ncbi:hypothetical protein F443_19897 [Phytophthora nicotianae P1569]|uniref:Tyr recombinase domain-containing protein n=1 Tax=Phytophthora nicotianae P1569 TaxID=1317065 RepID=V9E2Z2_PHYNI|nr:hypothetical protein F443_19897 [Phytophthora nicotianae P1569]
MRTRHLAGLKQFGLKSAISDGVINSESDSSPDCSHNTNSCFKECAGSVLHDKKEAQYRKKCSNTSSGYLSSAQHRVICGAAVLGFFFCLRGAEYLSVSSIAFKYRMYRKTDQNGRTTTRTLDKSEHPPVCPVFAALLLLRNASAINMSGDEPICSSSPGRVLSAEPMSNVLRSAAKACDVNPSNISTHFQRVGGATALHAAGVDADTIRMHGRWSSDADQIYIRQRDAASLQLARRMSSFKSKPNSNFVHTHPNGETRAHALALSAHKIM